MGQYALQLIADRGIPIFDLEAGYGPDVPMASRIVESTYLRDLRFVDKWHRAEGFVAPWDAYRRSAAGEQLWRFLRARFLKHRAGKAADSIDFDLVFRLVVELPRSTDRQRRTAALVALVTDPLVLTETGHQPSYRFWEELAPSRVSLMQDGGLMMSGPHRGSTVQVHVPVGTTARLVWRLISLQGEDRTEAPLFHPNHCASSASWSTNGIAAAVRSALTDLSEIDLDRWRVGRGISAPDRRQLDVAIAALLAPAPERARDAAYQMNAFFAVARGIEILQRHPCDVSVAAAGPLWKLPPKQDPNRQRRQWGAPHLRWRRVDPLRLLSQHLAEVQLRWLAQGNDPGTFRTEDMVFPTNMSDVTAVAKDPVGSMNRRLKMYQEEHEFLPDTRRYTTHSLRHGFVTTGRLLGVPNNALRQAGCWHDVSTFYSYMGRLSLGAGTASSAMAQAFDPPAIGSTGLDLSIRRALGALASEDTFHCPHCSVDIDEYGP